MHELITAVASLMIITLFISQFVANENLFLETNEIQQTINRYEKEEYMEDEITDRLDDMLRELNEIPNTHAVRNRDGIRITISNVIGPSAVCGINDNSISIDKKIDFKVKEVSDEESDNNGGAPDFDGSSEQIPDGDESDGAFDDLAG